MPIRLTPRSIFFILPRGDQANRKFFFIQDASRILAEWTIDPQEYNNNPTNPTLTHVAPGTMPSFQLPSLSSDSHTIPIINSEDRSFRCSWYSHGSVAQCYHALPDRLAFLRHLSVEHQVSGSQDGKIVCRLFDSKTGSVCNTPIKRGNFPRHADRHYHVRLHCQHCPSGKSFSRQDSWKRHMESKHGA